MSGWSDEWQKKRLGRGEKWAGTGGAGGSTGLMILAVIICRCEWSAINHLGAKLEWREVKNGQWSNQRERSWALRKPLLRWNIDTRPGEMMRLSTLLVCACQDETLRNVRECTLGEHVGIWYLVRIGSSFSMHSKKMLHAHTFTYYRSAACKWLFKDNRCTSHGCKFVCTPSLRHQDTSVESAWLHSLMFLHVLFLKKTHKKKLRSITKRIYAALAQWHDGHVTESPDWAKADYLRLWQAIYICFFKTHMRAPESSWYRFIGSVWNASARTSVCAEQSAA